MTADTLPRPYTHYSAQSLRNGPCFTAEDGAQRSDLSELQTLKVPMLEEQRGRSGQHRSSKHLTVCHVEPSPLPKSLPVTQSRETKNPLSLPPCLSLPLQSRTSPSEVCSFLFLFSPLSPTNHATRHASTAPLPLGHTTTATAATPPLDAVSRAHRAACCGPTMGREPEGVGTVPGNSTMGVTLKSYICLVASGRSRAPGRK